ncbi:uncharacterized protein A1O5_03162 [Cladophialophora psammophila CBS 110553]|uniref:Uncharacterized protein n=1 Tax=Cladophialophora psammophila CBS 110553 TaxID=1182543 RepID=W9WYX7_9EURO|nr:uncharacterized protein A1O5_03162 [Cladophialophora psammophila CBS 110553]EXJ73402.1 hypothetical protein A1O5_03162 [Cladophialophora psammophila CBS 110553]
MGLFDKLQSKLELYRLEQKYARRKNRTTFTTGAVYQDGEYFYTGTADARSPTMSTNSTGNSNNSSASNKRRSQMWVPPEQRR